MFQSAILFFYQNKYVLFHSHEESLGPANAVKCSLLSCKVPTTGKESVANRLTLTL